MRALRLALVLVATGALVVAGASVGVGQQPSGRIVLFNGEGNRLNAYDVTDLDAGEFPKQTVIPNAEEGGKDINAQICFDPRAPDHFIAGEDTGQPDIPAGWGYFRLTGTEVGSFGWEQRGKLTPTYQSAPVSDPENYGCAFRTDNTLFTTDIGEQFPPFPGSGQLILWFPPYASTEVAYCKIATDIPTPGGIYVDAQDRVYVASNREGTDPSQPSGAVYRYSGDWPTSGDAAGGCGRTDSTGAPLVDEGRIEREVFIRADQHVITPSAIWPAPNGNFYVSSVFSGTIAEYDAEGGFVREIMRPPPGEFPPYPSTGTPYGIVVDERGVIYYADLGVGPGPPPGPEDDAGSVRMIPFDGEGEPMDPVVIDQPLDFADGVGLRTFPAATPTPSPSLSPVATATSTSATPSPTASPTSTASPLPATGGGLAAAAIVVLLAMAAVRGGQRRRG